MTWATDDKKFEEFDTPWGKGLADTDPMFDDRHLTVPDSGMPHMTYRIGDNKVHISEKDGDTVWW